MKTNTLIIASLLIASLHAQDGPDDPYSAGRTAYLAAQKAAEADREDAPQEYPSNISICYEAFSLPLAMAAELQREQLADPALYAKIIAGLGKESIRQEILQVVRARSGQKSTTESISEHIYPAEFEPAMIGNSATNVPKEAKTDVTPGSDSAGGARTPATPTAFLTRNVGNTLEVESTLGSDQDMVDLRLMPEHITMVGRNSWGQEFSTTEQPEFEKQSINTSVTIRINQPFLLGTNSRPPASKEDPDSANRVWFAFVTATIAKP